MNILIADDSKMIRYMILEVLHELGYQDITEASNVSEAKTLLKGKKYSLVISDFHMPGETGLDFLKYLRATPEYAKLPFILLTTDNEKQNIVAAVQSGVQAYLFKPVQKNALEQKLTELSKTYEFQAPVKTAVKVTKKIDDLCAQSLSTAVSAVVKQDFGISFKTNAGELGSSQVCIGNNTMSSFSGTIQKTFGQSRCAVILDKKSHELYASYVPIWEKELNGFCCVVPEELTDSTYSAYGLIIEALTKNNFEYTGILIALGDTPLINLAGFVAATFLGGVRFISVPITLSAFLCTTVGNPFTLTANNMPMCSTRKEATLVWFDIAPLINLDEKLYAHSCAGFFRYLFIGGEEYLAMFKKLWDKLLTKDPDTVIDFCKTCIAVRASIFSNIADPTTRETVLNFANSLADAFGKNQSVETIIPGQNLYRAIVGMFDASQRAVTLLANSLPLYGEIFKKVPALEKLPNVDIDRIFKDAFDTPRKLKGIRTIGLMGAAGSLVIKQEIPDALLLESIKTIA